MARISQEDKLRKQKELNQIVMEIFWEFGPDAVTYAEVARQYGTSKSAIQRYYASQNDLRGFLKCALVPFVEERVDWTNEDSVLDSWFVALNDDNDVYFKKAVEFLMREALLYQPGQLLSKEFEVFRSRLKSAFKNEVDFFALVGRSYSTLTGGYNRYDRHDR
ncbi:TetR/AcrR family transcriptional regulator [Vibrio coralliirubri]|uniref:TetR/AcrR family transcriptional regulator n=1 Tax=Vibrio coralliirubri TaxID=1516159 RepID=UPI000EFD27A4|nr:TetR family transcriptional regulator [Vibrio coralliirubri]